nr:immunoglobulin light chain junction region [Mus musculus]
CKQSYNLWTF